jgi:NAD(P)-dependent dehydrogenase (short-subunit alcohol dehydrogenase family)
VTAKRIFITGAGRGIGLAIAQKFAAEGWHVGGYDLQAPQGACFAVAEALDVTDATAFQAAVNRFAEQGLDALVNNAGLLAVDDFENIPLARHHAIVEVNLKAVMTGAYAALPHLKQSQGVLVNLSSASALYGSPKYASYSATKFAVKGFTEALDIEWQRHGVRVTAILPLFVNTAMVTDIEKPSSLNRLGVHLQPQDIANAVWKAVHSHQTWWLVGAQTHALNLLTKLSPQRLNRWATARLSGY